MLTTMAFGRVFDYNYCIGVSAQMGGQGFDRPVDMALGANGVMYVLSRGEVTWYQRVTKLTTNHEYICDIGGSASDDPVLGKAAANTDGRFMWPSALEIDRDENVYVSDDYYHRISIFDKDGKYLGKWGTFGSGDGEIDSPSGLAFDKVENLFLVDAKNARVQIFTKEGKFLGKWGSPGSDEGQLHLPWGICIDPEDNVFIADWGNRRVQKFTPDGKHLTTFGAPGSGSGALTRPTGVAVDSEGDVYVTDWNANKLLIYAPDGMYLTALVGDAQQPSPWAQTVLDANGPVRLARRMTDMSLEWAFEGPSSVVIDHQDRIYVTEQARNRIQVYDKLKDFAEPAQTL